MKVITLNPVQHDNAFYDIDSVIDMPEDQAKALIALGAVRPTKDEFPITKGVAVKRKKVKESDKIVPTQAQIEEAEKAANEPTLTPEDQFSKGAIAGSVVAQGDVTKIKGAKEHRRK